MAEVNVSKERLCMTPDGGYLLEENARTIKIVARNRVKTIFYNS